MRKSQTSQLVFANAFLASTHLRMGHQQEAESAIRDALHAQPNRTTKIVESSYLLRLAV